MSTPILATKLFVPRTTAGAIPRTRLAERLDAALDGGALTLVSAPAGFGKTTLVARWAASCGLPVAWLSLDEADRDPARFFAYLVAALRAVAPSIDEAAGAPASPAPPTEASLTALLNALAALPEPIVLVLDDYHLADAPPIDDALAFLLDHLPPQLHIVITTREDPSLPLARLRGRGRLTEVRAADLRFTRGEATAFLTDAMGLALTDHDVAALETRTEGWIAGLQLAALSMRGRDDPAAFIEAFAGDDRYIVDYLVEEVLRALPADVRAFLLQTSILDRLCGSLCDAVTGEEHGAARLAALERGNVFLTPIDDRRRWYRYHHLFADVLRAHLLDEDPDLAPELHRRASAWHEREGDLPAAVDHAFAARDMSRAADLIERAMPALRRIRHEATLLAWLRALPDDVLRVRPVLSALYAGALLQALGDADGAERPLRDAERWLNPATAPTDAPVVHDAEEHARLPGQIALYRAGQALMRGDADQTVRHANRALTLLAEDDDLGQGAAAGLLALACWRMGDLDAAHRLYTACMARLERAGYIADMFGCALALADIRIAQGRLLDAIATCERALQLPGQHGMPALRGMADMHVAISELQRERGDLDAAARQLAASDALGEHMGLPQHPWRRRVAEARLLETRGDLDGALALLDEAERRYVGDFSPDVRPVAAIRARLLVACGRLDAALAWGRERGLSAGDAPDYLREYEHLTLARVLLADYRRDRDERLIGEAIGLLDRLLQAAEAGGRTGSVIEARILQALALAAQGDTLGALAPLGEALALAAPDGHVRLFADEGAPMARLLTAAPRGALPAHADRVLAELADNTADAEPSRSAQPLADPLTGREIEVLRLIVDGRSNREIADRLYLALDTVKGHNRRIFAKLEVQRRTEAIARARALGLV